MLCEAGGALGVKDDEVREFVKNERLKIEKDKQAEFQTEEKERVEAWYNAQDIRARREVVNRDRQLAIKYCLFAEFVELIGEDNKIDVFQLMVTYGKQEAYKIWPVFFCLCVCVCISINRMSRHSENAP